MKIADLHTHTALCHHAEGTPEEFFRVARARGLRFFGVSDHCPWPADYDDWRMSPGDLPAYLNHIERLTELAGSAGIRILRGIEADWIPEHADEIEANLKRLPLDYIIGSIHYVEGFAVDDPAFLERWRTPGVAEKIWNSYINALLNLVRRGGFQILGHVDLPKKFGYPAVRTPAFFEAFSEIFRVAAEQGIAVELNTAGLHKPIGEIYPSADLLKLARGAGVRITFGSDAHAPEELGRNFSEACALAASAGYRSFAVFENKQGTELNFE